MSNPKDYEGSMSRSTEMCKDCGEEAYCCPCTYENYRTDDEL